MKYSPGFRSFVVRKALDGSGRSGIAIGGFEEERVAVGRIGRVRTDFIGIGTTLEALLPGSSSPAV